MPSWLLGTGTGLPICNSHSAICESGIPRRPTNDCRTENAIQIATMVAAIAQILDDPIPSWVPESKISVRGRPSAARVPISATWRTFAIRRPGENHSSLQVAIWALPIPPHPPLTYEVSSMVTAADEFGHELRRRRVRAGLTQRELAARVRYSRETVAAVERGRRYASRELAVRCDDVLGTEGALARLWPRVEYVRMAADRRRGPRTFGTE